jgi:hypothetical protein
MRLAVFALAGLFAVTAVNSANAAVPGPVVALLGPSVGYLLSQSDLCQWGLAGKITKTYQDGYKAIGMTAAQQATAWEHATATQKRMAGLSAEARDHMKAETCTPAARARVEQDLTE